MYVIKIAFIAFIAFAVTPKAHAIDNIKMHSPTVGEDKRTMHKNEVLIRALEISKQIYGSYTIDFLNVKLSTARALRVIKKGEMINVFIAAANDHWDKFATPIKIPIRFGQLSYRLLLVNKSNLDAFKAIESLSDLKQLTAGLQRGWALNDIFNEVNIEVLTSSDFEGLFQMLNSGRFDYFPRTVYEAYNELENRSDDMV